MLRLLFIHYDIFPSVSFYILIIREGRRERRISKEERREKDKREGLILKNKTEKNTGDKIDEEKQKTHDKQRRENGEEKERRAERQKSKTSEAF